MCIALHLLPGTSYLYLSAKGAQPSEHLCFLLLAALITSSAGRCFPLPAEATRHKGTCTHTPLPTPGLHAPQTARQPQGCSGQVAGLPHPGPGPGGSFEPTSPGRPPHRLQGPPACSADLLCAWLRLSSAQASTGAGRAMNKPVRPRGRQTHKQLIMQQGRMKSVLN